jgi:hypothetical protein
MVDPNPVSREPIHLLIGVDLYDSINYPEQKQRATTNLDRKTKDSKTPRKTTGSETEV